MLAGWLAGLGCCLAPLSLCVPLSSLAEAVSIHYRVPGYCCQRATHTHTYAHTHKCVREGGRVVKGKLYTVGAGLMLDADAAHWLE